ncbi:MAG: putative DNA binding domain-containing protein [Desulfobulbus sp.]|nr:putative DNA binding domain-containing protein [Desulfobulbus sp.]
MDNAALLSLLEQFCRLPREEATVEFKSNLNLADDIGEYLSAMANTAVLERHERAWLIWGIDDATHAVKGTTFNPFTSKGEGKQALIMWLTQKIKPRPDFQFHELNHPDGKVIMLEIHPPRSEPLAFKGIRYIRIDSHKTRLSEHPSKEARLWELLGGVSDWSGELVVEATLEDLDPEAVDFARNKFLEYRLKSEPDSERHDTLRAETLAWDVATFLNKAHITKQGRLTRSALLLLGRDESAHFLTPADTKISWNLRDEQNRMIGGQHFGLPLLLASEALFKRIRNVTMEYMPDGRLFPVPVSQYDSWVVREALHNCIAHQDYRMGGKINVVEHPDRLIFTNLGVFIPPSVQWMLEHQSPPEHYRNQWLINGMIRLRMIDQQGSGIRRMFETQRERFFPLPDYLIDTDSSVKPRVEVAIHGRILDVKYTQLLMKRHDLNLSQVVLLDQVQKHQKLTPAASKLLKAQKLIEGRAPNYFISAKVAEWTGQKARYIRNRGLDDDYYRRLITEYLQKYAKASRKDLDELLFSKLPEVLTHEQKAHKVRNLLQSLRRGGVIRNAGSNKAPEWVLAG